jgi:hypothetical protein
MTWRLIVWIPRNPEAGQVLSTLVMFGELDSNGIVILDGGVDHEGSVTRKPAHWCKRCSTAD